MNSLERVRAEKELIAKSGRADLEALIRFLLDQVPDSCVFGFSDLTERSVVEWTKVPPYRLVSLRLGAMATSNMIWILAHELGHVVIGHDPDGLGRVGHERKAWDAGWRLIRRRFQFRAACWRSEFVARREFCLDTYRWREKAEASQ